MKTIKRDSISLAENRQEQYSIDNGVVTVATTWTATVEGPLSTGEHVYMCRDGKTAEDAYRLLEQGLNEQNWGIDV